MQHLSGFVNSNLLSPYVHQCGPLARGAGGKHCSSQEASGAVGFCLLAQAPLAAQRWPLPKSRGSCGVWGCLPAQLHTCS